MCFYLFELKQNCTKIYVKEIFSFAKRVSNRPGSEENVFFFRIFKQKPFLQKKLF